MENTEFYEIYNMSKLEKMKLISACAMAVSYGRYCDVNKRSVFGVPEYLTKTGNTLSDGKPRKKKPKQLKEFKIKGHTVMAYSRKDAITRLKAKGKL